MTRLTTKHLAATALSVADLETLVSMHRDPRVMVTLGGVRSAGQTRRFLAWNVAHWRRHGCGLWVFRNRADGRFVGRGGLRHTAIGGVPEVEIAYALLPEFWGKGLATEMARVCLDVGLHQLGLENVVAFTLPDNHASRRVMEKVGLRYEREIVHHDLRHMLYRRRR